MKNKLLGIAVVSVFGLIFSGCSYKAGYTDIDNTFYKTKKDIESKKFEEIGTVSLVENGWLFSSCDTMGRESTIKLEQKAKSLGADAVIDIRWQGEQGIMTKYPQCKTAWGWVLLWPAWFIPGTSDTTVSGTMIKYQ